MLFRSEMVRDMGEEVKRRLSAQEREYELGIAQERIRAQTLGLPSPDGDKAGSSDQVATSAAARAPAGAEGEAKPAEKEVRSATPADVDVLRSLQLKPGDLLMAEIIERYPNGNYKLRGTKRIPYKGGAPRFLTVTAIAKGSDIGDDDTISSGKLYEYRLESSR